MKRKTHPISVLRWVTVGVLLSTLLCFFFPFLRVTPQTGNFLTSLVFKDVKPTSMSGFQLMLASLSDKPLTDKLEIGALPSNPLTILAFVSLIAAVVILLLPLRRWSFLVSSLCSLLCSVSTVLTAVLLTPFYSRFTDGGEALKNLIEDGLLSYSAEPGLVLVAILSFLVYLSCFLLHYQLRDDPYFRVGNTFLD